MAVMLICQLPDDSVSKDDDDDVTSDVTDREKIAAVSVVTSFCERPRNLLHPVDLRRRRRRRNKSSDDTMSESRQTNSYLVDFTVCVPPIFGNITTTDLVEFIEVNQLTRILLGLF